MSSPTLVSPEILEQLLYVVWPRTVPVRVLRIGREVKDDKSTVELHSS